MAAAVLAVVVPRQGANMAQQENLRSTRLTGKYGQYPDLPNLNEPISNAQWDKGVRMYPNTNMLPARSFGPREDRNHRRVASVFKNNMSPVFRGPGTPTGSGLKWYQAVYDPSSQAWIHRGTHPERKSWEQTPDQILLARRKNDNVMHSSRIAAAAPAQVAWKVPYVVGARNVEPIGPYQTTMQRSILYRLSNALSKITG